LDELGAEWCDFLLTQKIEQEKKVKDKEDGENELGR
jgi:hypothetical protein